MIYDVPFRHHQALDPSALTTVIATLHAIRKAVDDCRNAGVEPNSDPAVVLLARHMAIVSTNRAPRAVLRHACTRRLADLTRFPTLLALAIRGVEYDASAKERFHSDATDAMNALAVSIGLAPETFQVVSFQGGRDQSGHVLLAAEEFAVTVRIGARHEGREVAYRAVCEGTNPPNRYAPMAELLKPDRFAARLHRDLSIAVRAAAPADPVLVAG
jgi:hypothetical protein